MKPEKLIRMYGHEAGKYFTAQEAADITARTRSLHRQYCLEHEADPPALKEHTEPVIYVGIALYRAIQETGHCPEEAFQLTDRIFQGVAAKVAGVIRMLLRIPGLYRRVPAIVHQMIPRKYSETAGFRFTFYDTEKSRVRFDMTACPYAAVCEKMGCPELTPIFCNNDDCCYGAMHPRLIWQRTQTIGHGGDLCDFDIAVRMKARQQEVAEADEDTVRSPQR